MLTEIILFYPNKTRQNEKFSVVVTNFPAYDFVRAVAKNDDLDLTMLILPDSEIHDYEPSPLDIQKIIESDFKTVTVFSVVISAMSFVLGLILSYYLGTSTGSTIILINALFYIPSYFCKK